jgi:hypothetical protein
LFSGGTGLVDRHYKQTIVAAQILNPQVNAIKNTIMYAKSYYIALMYYQMDVWIDAPFD